MSLAYYHLLSTQRPCTLNIRSTLVETEAIIFGICIEEVLKTAFSCDDYVGHKFISLENGSVNNFV